MNYKSGFPLYIFLVLFVFSVIPGVYAADFYVTQDGQSLN